jgi:cobalt-zinc-cadmium efflux system membrane fusion protein
MKTTSIMMAVFLLFFVGCTNKKADEHNHEVSSLEPLAYTIYSEKTELFVEFKPLVVGSTSKFAAHFTIIGENFLPLTEGKITVSLVIGEKGIRNSAKTASSPGIFRLALTPTTAGNGKLVFDIETKDYTDQIVIENVTVYPTENTALENQTESTNSDEIVYLKEQAWKVEFANAPVMKQPFSDIIKTNGQIISAPGDEMMVVSQIAGKVSFANSSLSVGSKVNQGTKLFGVKATRLETNNLSSIISQNKIAVEKAEKDYQRASDLAKDNIVSQKELLEIKERLDKAKKELEQSSFSNSYTQQSQSANAPISGYLTNILISEGQFVEIGTPLAVISKNQKLQLQAHLSQRYFNKLTTVKSANFKLVGVNEVFTTESLNGRVISFGKSVSENSPFIPITFEIDNIGNLIPGSIAEVYLKSTPIQNALIVPTSALMEEQGNFYVYVQTGGESFEKREVKLGASDGQNVQVLSGISEGERVVTKGAYQIKLSTASGKLPAHGHEH